MEKELENSINSKEMELPVIAMRGLVVFPKMIVNFDISRKKSIYAVKSAMNNNQKIFISTQKDASINNPALKDIYDVGVIAKILQVIDSGSDGGMRIVVEGVHRAVITQDLTTPKYLKASIKEILTGKYYKDDIDLVALSRVVKSKYKDYIELVPKIPPDIIFKIGMSNDIEEVCDVISSNINLPYSEKQKLLSVTDLRDRLEMLLDFIIRECCILTVEKEIQDNAHQKIDTRQREYLLREQLNYIREELGEDDSPDAEAEEYAYKISKLKLTDKVRKSLEKECVKLSKMPSNSQEANIISNYLDVCISLPWGKYSNERIDLPKVRKALDKEHFGLNKVKEKILQQLAVRKNSPNAKGQIICLVGPPGVGKTSIAMSVAKAINRKSARIALGGIRDEAEIRGHRKTYLGSMAGRIINSVRQAGTSNCLLVLDEIDKLANDYKGDPTSALLEVLDSEQNNAFYDHYIDLPFDLSKVMFITTANDASAIPAPLRDRMEIIELSSYTREEKFNIAKKHLIPKQLKNCNVLSKNLKFTNDAIYCIIDNYTKEAGVRNLERCVATIISKYLLSYFEQGTSAITKITAQDVEQMLGTKKYLSEDTLHKDEVGVVNGLAWTSVGGELLPVEVAVMDGTGKLELTGSLGDVMQESAKAAVTCIRSHATELGVDSMFYKNKDIHIHAPEGAVPKDGPSAGVTMATAIYSALTNRPVRGNVAMTGEITLRGNILAIGGLKEKSMAAYKSNIKTVIIPEENARDLQDIDNIVRDNINFVPISNITEALKIAVD